MPLQKLKTYIHLIWQWKLSGLKTDSDLQKSVHLREYRVFRSSVYLAVFYVTMSLYGLRNGYAGVVT